MNDESKSTGDQQSELTVAVTVRAGEVGLMSALEQVVAAYGTDHTQDGSHVGAGGVARAVGWLNAKYGFRP